MNKILIIEDNKDINLMLAEFLESEGFEITSVFDGAKGMQEAKEKEYDLVLLDIMLPYKSGERILVEIRKKSSIPIIIISSKNLVETKINLLKLGADDYITKPFDLGEVAARVTTNLRRFDNEKKKNTVLKYKDMELDVSKKRVILNGQELELTAKEYCIIELLMQNPGKVFSKINIYESIWEEEYLGDDNAVKTHMSNLRNKLKNSNPCEEYVETVWGLGYRLYKV
ncbi:response regulator transcription factor [Bacillus velezensis]|uniref:response regulator transcription factor n=1 Tax=Bacillus TaxID=1386 RepID=UPI00045895DB|nr:MULTISPECIES: response regulator transcription factor [Bacillus]AIW36568.1 chemotaxis protein CheY [Bacillus subtilis]AHZ14666.1 response regulator with CheY-like receiver domain and winged-helix DNA-binding domain [Bacillus velezensis SQR9]AKF77514.1 chemotaxis protein CheY [Bacillus velezensis]AWD13187.1 DNA-binding response regulator [Bacillus velezensis]MDH2303555.1 response regulator transcription factor [Bacillus velezensis]